MGHRVRSGTGEELGSVVAVVNDANGQPRKLVFVESEGDEPRFVHLRFVRAIEDGVVRLAGPREGYHITRVRGGGTGTMGTGPGTAGRVMRDPDDDESFWAGS